jgi:hypothetical protein
MLPVIYIPFYVLKGRVTIVFGLGLCGIIPLPMILFVNMGTMVGSIIFPINMIVDMLLKMTKMISNMETKVVEGMMTPMIKSLDSQIREMEIEKEDIPYQIQQIKALQIKDKAKILDSVNAVQGNDLSFKAELPASEEPLIQTEPSDEEEYEPYIVNVTDLVEKLSKIVYPKREPTTNNNTYGNNGSSTETAQWTQIDRNVATSTGTLNLSDNTVIKGASSIALSAFSNINGAAFTKYAAGGYLTNANSIKLNIKSRNLNIKNIPNDFINTIRKVSKSTGVPMIQYIIVAASESGFKNRPANSIGYGGYFGQGGGIGKGYGYSLEDQARSSVTESYKNAKKAAPGASVQDCLVLGYIYHHLPKLGTKYWKQTGGKIYSLDPNYIASHYKKIYPTISRVRLAEAIVVNICAQWLSAQAVSNSSLQQFF